MRSSFDKSDPGWPPKIYPAVVTVNGVVVPKCITADTEEGIAICYKTNESGAVVRSGDCIERVTHRGTVRIEPA